MTKDIHNIKTVFMGTSTFADIVLNSLLDEKYNLAGVYTQPDKKSGRDGDLKKSPVKITAEKNGLDIFQPEKWDAVSVSELKNLKPDLIVVVAYGKILPGEILKMPQFGCLNIHASLLPKFRGASPIHNTLLSGESETGTTVMLMNEGVDTGDILAQEKISIHPDELFPELSGRLASVSASLLVETLPKWINEEMKPEKQNDLEASVCQVIEKEQGYILWSDDAQSIYNRYRAFYTWPGIFSFWKKNGSRLRVKLNKIGWQKSGPEKERHLGEIFEIDGKVAVQAVSDLIILEEVQIEGKNNSSINDFINGYPDFIGSILK